MGRRRASPLSYWNQNYRPFSWHSLQHPHPNDTDSPMSVAIGKVQQSDLHCAHSRSSHFSTHQMQNFGDTFDLLIKVLHLSSLEGFASLSWMNQSVTASDKKHTQTAKLGPVWPVLWWDFRGLPKWLVCHSGMNEQQSLYRHSFHSNLT